MTASTFSLEKALHKLGIKALNEMQLNTIDASKTNPNLVVLSPTGSGKTLAFLISALDKLDTTSTDVQCLIITPTRELAIQIEGVFRDLGTGYKVNASFGGRSVQVEKNSFIQPPAVLVGTPGRLSDHIFRENIDMSQVKTLVLDEFDKSLEMGFEEQMKMIIQHLPNLKTRLLTSATNLSDIPPFTGTTDPLTLNFLSDEPTGLEQKMVIAQSAEKPETLVDLLCNLNNLPTIIFCNHRDTVDRLSEIMTEMGIENTTLHGGLEQDERERCMIKFRNGSANFLVTTDLASRGLDIPEIKYIIHYQLPTTKDSFIHRNGRTARMSATGTSFLFTTEEDKLPDYIDQKPSVYKIPDDGVLPPKPDWVTLYLSGGKKDKINKIDIVGFFLKIGQLNKEDIGLIIVQDYSSYVAVKKKRAHKLLEQIKDQKIKGKKLKIAIAK
jgi:superfamily II DNA/RNA helicase